jgi:hypothetical protein
MPTATHRGLARRHSMLATAAICCAKISGIIRAFVGVNRSTYRTYGPFNLNKKKLLRDLHKDETK